MEKIAAIDIGSNAVRVTTADLESKDLILLKERIRIPLRLGTESFGENNKFSPEFIKYAERTFKEIRNTLNGLNINRCRSIATSAFRDAKNNQILKNTIFKSSGILIHEISGEQEAQLILKAIQTCSKIDSSSDYLLFDLGGGSLELSIIEKSEIKGSLSVNLGTVRFLEAEKRLKNPEKIEQWIAPKVKEIHQFLDKKLKTSKKLYVIGTGGNFRRLIKLKSEALHKKSKFITPDDLSKLLATLEKTTYLERLQKFDLRPDRADVIIPAMKVIKRVIEGLPVLRIYAPNIGLDKGILISMSDGASKQDQIFNYKESKN